MTNPERFRPLHELARTIVDKLNRVYDVALSETFDPSPDVLRPIEHARQPLTLKPSARQAAPVAIAFTTLPGLIVRYGRWLSDPFPSCACDACAATATGEAERLDQLLHDVVAGQFREEITIPLFGDAKLHWALGEIRFHGRGTSGFRVVPREQARILIGSGPKRMQWQPWTLR